MREILFRGKRIDSGEWVYGTMYKIATDLNPFILTGGKCGCSYQVEEETVGQYTGLNDKNGNRIWEGDIVRCGTGRICKVTFFISPGVSGFDLVPIGGFDAPPPHKWSLFTDTEVIGNVNDNPELLGK